jgi:hypothetical protein
VSAREKKLCAGWAPESERAREKETLRHSGEREEERAKLRGRQSARGRFRTALLRATESNRVERHQSSRVEGAGSKGASERAGRKLENRNEVETNSVP